MNQHDQQAIDDLFRHLYRSTAQAGPPDRDAEARIRQHLQQGPPGLSYQMAQTLVGQQAALRQLRAQLADCEQQLRQSGLSGQQGYGQQYQQRAGWGSGGQGFLAGAGQIALGVGGGILAAEALSNLFGGDGLFGDDDGGDYDDRGDYDGGQNDSGQADGGQYDSSQYDSGQYDTGQYDGNGGYDDTGFDGGGFDDGGFQWPPPLRASSPYPGHMYELVSEPGVADAHNLAWKLAFVTRGIAGQELLETYDAERRPAAALTVEQAYTRYVLRVDNSLPKDDLMPPLEDLAIELGAIYRSMAVLDDRVPPQQLDDPHARTWLTGSRVPHVPLSADGNEISSLDAAGPGFAVLADSGLDQWRDAAAEVGESLGVDVSVVPVAPGSLPASAPSEAAGSGWTGAALIRPDGVIAWKPSVPAEAPGQLAGVMRSLLSRAPV